MFLGLFNIFYIALDTVSRFYMPFFASNYVKITKAIGRLARMSVLDTEVDGSNPGSSMLLP